MQKMFQASRRLFRLKKDLFLIPLLLLSLVTLQSGCKKNTISAPEDDFYSDTDPTDKMSWWHKARFGMFIHWGVYSVPAGFYKGQPVFDTGEWIMLNGQIPRSDYAGFASQFNPTQYNPEAWVKMAKDAGMKYIIISAKHHDGFALFDSQASDWNMVKATPYGKDAIAPLVDACRKYGLKIGLYYSQATDWYNPGGAASGPKWDPTQEGDMDEYIDKIAVPQVKEILTKYGDIAELWWDLPINMTYDRCKKFEDVIEKYPKMIVNDRLGDTTWGDITTPEQFVPGTGIPGRDWETCMTLNDTWGYKSNDNNWKTPTKLIHSLAEIASKGGNFLLNIGPTATGEFPAPAVERLAVIGGWMKKYGDAIYGTTASPFKKLPWGYCTKKLHSNSATLYLHVAEWPANGELLLPGLNNTIQSAKIMLNNTLLTTENTSDGVIVHVPANSPDDILPVLKIETNGALNVDPTYIGPSTDGKIHLGPEMVDIHNNDNGYSIIVELKSEFNIGYWIDAADWISWNVNIKQPGTYTVKATLGVPNNSNFTIDIAGQQLNASAVYTTSWNIYNEQTLGTITINQAGKYVLSIHTAPGWYPTNFREIKLEP